MRLLYSFLKELRLSTRSYYFYLEIIMAIIIIVVLRYVVPENFESSSRLFAYVSPDLADSISTKITDTHTGENAENTLILLDSIDAVVAVMEEDRNSVGLTVTSFQGSETPGTEIEYRLIFQGYESERLRNIMQASVSMIFAPPAFTGTPPKAAAVETIGQRNEHLSDRNSVLPPVLLLNAAFMGLFIIAAFIFMDKEEGTIKAFAVTPSHIWEYLLGKMAVMLLAGMLSGLMTVLLVAGSSANYVLLILLLAVSNLFGSSLGLLVASFFDNMAQAMGTIFIIIYLMAMPAVSYYMPAFSPLPMRILPSYPLLFAFRETLLDDPDYAMVLANAAIFAVVSVILFLLANKRYKKIITI